MEEKQKITWAYEFSLSTTEIMMAVVFGIVGVVSNYALGYLDPFFNALGPIGSIIGSLPTGFRWTVQFIPAYLRKKGILFPLSVIVSYAVRGILFGAEITFIYWIAACFVPVIVLHLMKYRWRRGSYIVAFEFCSITLSLLSSYLFGTYLIGIWAVLVDLVIHNISIALTTVVLGIVISEALVAAGVTKKVP